MSISSTPSSANPVALGGQSPATQPTDDVLAAWRDALNDEAPGRVAEPPSGHRGAWRHHSAANDARQAANADRSRVLSQGGGGSPVPAIEPDPLLMDGAGPPADKEGHYIGSSVKSAYPFASEDGLARAFAAQFKVPGMQVGILGEAHSVAAQDILLKTALATRHAVTSSGRDVCVAVELPMNSDANMSSRLRRTRFHQGEATAKCPRYTRFLFCVVTNGPTRR
jgi:hypothetical protein